MSEAYKIDKKLLLQLFSGFILFTMVGTLSHELAHFLTARSFGYNASLHFNYTHYTFPTPAYLSPELSQKWEKHSLLISIAGPVQTLLFGTIGFILLSLKRKRNRSLLLTTNEWLLVFLTFFWSRQLFNLFGVLSGWKNKSAPYSDEIRVAETLNLPSLSIFVVMALLALIVLSFTFFRLIPLQQRFTFLLAGLTGSLLGFYLWMFVLGPIVLP